MGRQDADRTADRRKRRYQISTGAELAWFVAKSSDADVTGVLTANINLGKYAWLNISSSKKVTLDGACFEITGLNATAGLFAQIGSNSYIHDLTIRGAVSGKGNAGAIAGYASGTAPKNRELLQLRSHHPLPATTSAVLWDTPIRTP